MKIGFTFKIIVMIIIIVGVALSALFQHEKISYVVTENQRHLQVTALANELSSYAKRAEGHLFLYLMLGSNTDKHKFFNRSASLKEFAIKLSPLLDNDQSDFNKTILNSINRLVSTGTKIITSYDIAIQTNSFEIDQHEQALRDFHELSSSIRRSGVTLVKNSSKMLAKQTGEIEKQMTLERMQMGSFILISIIMMVIIIRQSRKLYSISKKLHFLSFTDELTGIANRRAYKKAIQKEWQRAIRNKNCISIMLIDIDYFKQFNDRYGHTEGDKCLISVAKALQSCLKRPADLIARYGGEEFVVILPDTTNVTLIAEMCRQAIQNLHIANKDSSIADVLTITIGVGTTQATPHTTAAQLLKQVDKALYQGKNSGRNRVQLIDPSNN